MTFIIDTLYLGSYLDVHQQKPSFQAIYNFAKECDKPVLKRDFEYYELPLTDTYNQTILAHINTAVPLITNDIHSKKVVFLHCFAGQSRSATFAIAYLMYAHGKTLSEAYQFIKEKRKITPNIHFMSELIEYEKQLFGSSEFDLNEYIVQFITDSFDIPYDRVQEVFLANGQDYDTTIDKLFE